MPVLTAVETLGFYARLVLPPSWPRRQRDARCADVLATLGLAQCGTTLVRRLAGESSSHRALAAWGAGHLTARAAGCRRVRAGAGGRAPARRPHAAGPVGRGAQAPGAGHQPAGRPQRALPGRAHHRRVQGVRMRCCRRPVCPHGRSTVLHVCAARRRRAGQRGGAERHEVSGTVCFARTLSRAGVRVPRPRANRVLVAHVALLQAPASHGAHARPGRAGVRPPAWPRHLAHARPGEC